ncbi:chromophore lyase CpcT/CpeT [Aquidulcibacter sp.]|uniref:chromophore lyase CpcT/CpeT n=1 Tax=Aquidulcibacter sp. TaxID=2052990 RepID=UPI0025BAB425|nr:chromophore lyase CpcT/CpeT [Aquidulcibacter sp.]MCA3693513.1 chromophore lyase CpcT/CpeT [Aquidulcibacter sp.]
MPITTRQYHLTAALIVAGCAYLLPTVLGAQATPTGGILSPPSGATQALPPEMTPEGILKELVTQSIAEQAGVPELANPTPVPVPVKPLTPAMKEVLNKDLLDLADLLTGRWDNELQTFFEPELNVPLPLRHERLHAVVKPIEAPEFGPVSFYVEYRKGGETGPVARQRIWTLSVDPELNGIRLSGFAPKEGKPLEGAWRLVEGVEGLKPGQLKKEAFTPVMGCDIIWRRRGEGFSGATRPAACKLVTNADKRVLSVSEQHDISANVWEVRDVGVDERGVRVFGGSDTPPTRLKRAQTFSCWASVAKGAERAIVSDLVVHDQGGLVTAEFAGGNPAKLRLRLRNVEWPIGQNRPSLTLYLLKDSDDRAEGFAWGEPTANRLALDVGGTQVSCTRDPRALWR